MLFIPNLFIIRSYTAPVKRTALHTNIPPSKPIMSAAIKAVQKSGIADPVAAAAYALGFAADKPAAATVGALVLLIIDVSAVISSRCSSHCELLETDPCQRMLCVQLVPLSHAPAKVSLNDTFFSSLFF